MKKEKKIKTELDYLKSIDSSLLIVVILLMGVIAIAAIATVGIYSNVDVTANAAAENLLDAPIEIATLENSEDANYIFLDKAIGLELGKSYSLSYTYKGTTKVITLVGYSYAEAGIGENIDGIVIPQERMAQDFSFYTDDNRSSSDGSGSIIVMIMDKAQKTEEAIAYNENSAIIMVAINAENYELPFVINSITASEENTSENLSAGTIVENITGSFTTFLTGTGQGIVDFFDTIFTNGEGGISILGIVALSMMGLGIATGIIRYLLAKAS